MPSPDQVDPTLPPDAFTPAAAFDGTDHVDLHELRFHNRTAAPAEATSEAQRQMGQHFDRAAAADKAAG
ncbi:hypothetical protein [Micromonospora sp. NPDC005324]|uniref:hypothetical protein n=1 Tax=Micromonospora sp. NPDC005324 TaxID=3157033 RepID=UPI0033BD2370